MSNDFSRRFIRQWQALAYILGLDESKTKEVGDFLLTQYSSLDRHYHNPSHIISMLDNFVSIESSFEQSDSAKLAIFFHDAVYDVSRSDNEEQSVIKMREHLQDVADDATLTSAAFSIEATKAHAITPRRDTNLIIDLDMAILGQAWEIYERYAKRVMLEYLPVYGEASYRQGRLELFLEPTIAQGVIFLTNEFQYMKQPAIRNMQREAKILKSGKSFAG